MTLASEEAREYELLTQAVYQGILARNEGNIEVSHNVPMPGRSGASHQCDVLWRFQQAGVEYLVVVECKNHSKAISIGMVRDFASVLEDLGARGIMVTRTGFQSGAEEFARHSRIGLKLLRTPVGDDWQGLVQKVQTRMTLLWFDEPEHPIDVFMDVHAGTQEAYERLTRLAAENRLTFPKGPKTRLCDSTGNPITEEFGWWIPKNVRIVERQPGGPYVEEIDPAGLHVPLTIDGKIEYWPLRLVRVTYFVKSLMEETFTIDAMDVVQAVLKDYSTGDVEHFHPRTP